MEEESIREDAAEFSSETLLSKDKVQDQATGMLILSNVESNKDSAATLWPLVEDNDMKQENSPVRQFTKEVEASFNFFSAEPEY
jgi:hypothetical protein